MVYIYRRHEKEDNKGDNPYSRRESRIVSGSGREVLDRVVVEEVLWTKGLHRECKGGRFLTVENVLPRYCTSRRRRRRPRSLVM